MASSTSNSSRIEKPVSLVWGCELNEQSRTYLFKVMETDKYEYQLVLRTVCLGENAKDEVNIVEIISRPGEGGDGEGVPVATLRSSILPMATVAGFELNPPVAFRLKVGSGPVYISGQHIALEADYSWMEEEEEEEAEEEEVESPPKPVKRPAANKKMGQAKKKKLDKEEPEDEMASVEDEDSPVKKGKGAGRGKKLSMKK
ncbi:nucleoplasmin-2 isoform X2 [Rhinatrema bivittatum]|uniref:nucleoplasmin-2 isoform X2 n=1 Tax=Rhinatrema bivittatum TaxID=194408 RepID=UPI00112E0DDF|nr:nucleoplasmin-2 isoform X2 [Rhinatrema bivittatum]